MLRSTRRRLRARRETRVAAVRVRAALALAASLLLASVAGAGQQSPLARRISEIVDAPQFRAVRWGVLAVALDDGAVLVARDSERRFVPASNLKLYTTALALARLGPTYKWKTSVYATAKPDKAGRLAGDLVVVGRGDPTFSARFSTKGDDATERIERLADAIAATGLRRVTGKLVADESYFTGARFGYGWEWNDLQWGYGAEVSALSVADNVLEVRVAPAARAGRPCEISLSPRTSYLKLVNRTITNPKGGPNDLGIYRAEGTNTVDVWGHLPVGFPPFTSELAVHDPAGLFATLLASALERRNVAVAGGIESVDARARETRPFAPENAVEIASVESAPLADVVHETNKVSQNLYAELLLRTVGRVAGKPDAASSEAAGTAEMTALLASAGIDTSAVALEDGSGLSRGNYVTPATTVGLLAWARKQPFGQVYYDSLPSAGTDGTLERRFANSPAAGKVHAKTGTLGDTSALSGYLTSKSGREIVFSIMVNNAPGESKPLRQAIDAVVLELASE